MEIVGLKTVIPSSVNYIVFDFVGLKSVYFQKHPFARELDAIVDNGTYKTWQLVKKVGDRMQFSRFNKAYEAIEKLEEIKVIKERKEEFVKLPKWLRKEILERLHEKN